MPNLFLSFSKRKVKQIFRPRLRIVTMNKKHGESGAFLVFFMNCYNGYYDVIFLPSSGSFQEAQ